MFLQIVVIFWTTAYLNVILIIFVSPNFRLQHGVEDHKKLKDVTPTLAKLENLQERWKDDYMANRALRDVFRVNYIRHTYN